MDEQLKQRLIGAAVLAALMVIFVPMLFESRPPDAEGLTRPIPPAPAADRGLVQRLLPDPPSAEARSDDPPAAIEPAPLPSVPSAEPAEPAPAIAAAAPKPSPVAASPSAPPSGWVVQAGSFSQQENAERLVGELRRRKLPGYSERVVIDGAPHYRVRIGPVVREREAEQLRARIGKEFDLNGQVVRYP